MYFQYSIVHAFGSTISASIGSVGPRYLISYIGLFYLYAFITGMVFLAFDIRARDKRDGILEVLDAKPFTNVDLLLGRFVGLVITAWLPLFFLTLILQCLGWLLPILGSPIGQTIEPVSLFSFPFFIALPAIAFSCALIILVTVLVRNQIVALALSLAILLGLNLISSGILPYTISSSFDLVGFYQTNLPSDWNPSISIDYSGWIQRLGILLISIGLIFISALIHPRIENRQSLQAIVTTTLSLAGVSLLLLVLHTRMSTDDQIERWRNATLAKQDITAPNILDMQANVSIDPGREMKVELKILLKSPANSHIENALFTLNPGFEIREIVDQNGNKLNADFNEGLLNIELNKPLNSEQQIGLILKYEGVPDIKFAYLDSAIDYRKLAFGEDNVKLLGLDNAIFSEKYVALMPGIHWLPMAGAGMSNHKNNESRRDFYTFQMSVLAPKGWIPAAPGLRHTKNENSNVIEYSFKPKTAVPEVALLVAPFESYSTKIDNIVFEVLLHSGHDNNIKAIKPAEQQIKQWIADKLSLAKAVGLEYPFDALTLVEVPNTLRGFSGGWRMESVLAPPGMVLIKETGFPTARFDNYVARISQKDALNNDENSQAVLIRNRLINFFSNDFSGGNIFTGIAKSFFAHRTSATGNDAIALEYTLNQLATMVLSGQQSYFSVSRIADLKETMSSILSADNQPDESISNRIINTINNDNEVWEGVLNNPFSHMKPWQSPGLAVDILALKAGGISKLIYDMLGPVKTGQLLSMILDNHKDGTYDLSDMISASSQIDSNLGLLIKDMFNGVALAGFTSDNVRLERLPDNVNGDTQIQLALQLNNNEKVAGYARVYWLVGDNAEKNMSKPIRVEGQTAVNFGVILSEIPREVYIEPYISLNRKSFLVKKFTKNDLVLSNEIAYEGIRKADWNGSSSDRIVVDDLDEAFLSASNNSNLNEHQSSDLQLDQGLPIVSLAESPAHWSRHSDESAWGKYRHTFAFIVSEDANSKASFTTDIPEKGRWKLELHLPHKWIVDNEVLGTLEISIKADSMHKSVEFDTKSWEEGWSFVDEFDLSSGKVVVELSNKKNGQLIVADAIAWSPVSPSRVQAQNRRVN